MAQWRSTLQRMAYNWRESWRVRRQLDGPALHRGEFEFLPAADALRDTPPHPAPRWLLGALLALAVVALAWATLGRVDVVAVADGKVLAAGRSKPIQADSIAVVKQIHVRDGQQVRAGQLLVEFDSTQTRAELGKVRDAWMAAQLEQAGAEALLQALAQDRPPQPSAPSGLPPGQREAWEARVQAQYLELRSAMSQATAMVDERTGEVAAVSASVDSLRQSLPINREMVADYRRLQAGQYVARHAWLERERQLREQEQQLISLQARLGQAEAARQQALQQRERVQAETRRNLLDQRQQAEQRVAAFAQDLQGLGRRDAQTRLLAPVDGTVQQLAVSAPGAVVTPAQPVLMLVPRQAPAEVEAFLASRDVAFVHVGQAAKLKIDAFDFTRYGMLAGEVTSVSSDAIADPQRGLVYSVRIRLSGTAGDARALPLAPGMGVRAEIQTGRRRILDYFLSPLQRRLDESLHER